MPKFTAALKPVGIVCAVLLASASPALAHDAPAEAANKQVVLDFYQALNAADAAGTTKTQIQAIAEKYLSPDYVQHAEPLVDLPGPGTALWTRACTAALAHIAAEEAHDRKRKADRERARYGRLRAG